MSDRTFLIGFLNFVIPISNGTNMSFFFQNIAFILNENINSYIKILCTVNIYTPEFHLKVNVKVVEKYGTGFCKGKQEMLH